MKPLASIPIAATGVHLLALVKVMPAVFFGLLGWGLYRYGRGGWTGVSAS